MTTEKPELFVCCADVGAPGKAAFGWSGRLVDDASGYRPGGGEIADCASEMAQHLNRGCSVSLGIESPLYVPFRGDPQTLTAGRLWEGSPAWSSQIGATVLATGLVVTCWILRKVLEQLTVPRKAFLNWQTFRDAGCGLHIWEAKVSGHAKAMPPSHSGDARVAVERFIATLPTPDAGNVDAGSAFSLVGAALVRTGWSTDLSLLSETCIFLVV